MRKYWILLIIFVIISIYLKIVGENSFPLNAEIFKLINYHQVGLLNPFFVFFSKYGREYIWIPLTAILLVFKKTRRIAIVLAASFIVSIILGEAGKIIMAQLRPFYYISPDYLLVPKPTDYSYPSGHALIVGDGAMVLFKTSPKWLWIPFMIEALIVSYSRVYVGVHWPIDILGGWLLGSWIAYFTVDMDSRGVLKPIEKLFKVEQ